MTQHGCNNFIQNAKETGCFWREMQPFCITVAPSFRRNNIMVVLNRKKIDTVHQLLKKYEIIHGRGKVGQTLLFMHAVLFFYVFFLLLYAFASRSFFIFQGARCLAQLAELHRVRHLQKGQQQKDRNGSMRAKWLAWPQAVDQSLSREAAGIQQNPRNYKKKITVPFLILDSCL